MPEMGVAPTRGIYYYRRLGGMIYYPAGLIIAGSITSGALPADYLYAYPFITQRRMTLYEIVCYVDTQGSAGSLLRLGIYEDNGNCYPGKLVLDSGDLDSSVTGDAMYYNSQILAANRLYWFVILGKSVAIMPILSKWTASQAFSILGQSDLGSAPMFGYSKNFTYAALPDPFPSGGLLTNSIFEIAVVISSQV